MKCPNGSRKNPKTKICEKTRKSPIKSPIRKSIPKSPRSNSFKTATSKSPRKSPSKSPRKSPIKSLSPRTRENCKSSCVNIKNIVYGCPNSDKARTPTRSYSESPVPDENIDRYLEEMRAYNRNAADPYRDHLEKVQRDKYLEQMKYYNRYYDRHPDPYREHIEKKRREHLGIHTPFASPVNATPFVSPEPSVHIPSIHAPSLHARSPSLHSARSHSPLHSAPRVSHRAPMGIM